MVIFNSKKIFDSHITERGKTFIQMGVFKVHIVKFLKTETVFQPENWMKMKEKRKKKANFRFQHA